jgi:putative spermidine/putrescine transport system substrate-binding protein
MMPRRLTVAIVRAWVFFWVVLCIQGCTPDKVSVIAVQGVTDHPWATLEQQARGTSVNLLMWGGDPAHNIYIDDYVIPELKKTYGIMLKRIPLSDSASFTSKLLAEKQLDRQQGSVDLLWVNGENFAVGAKATLWAKDWACKLPNARYINWQDPSINRDFGFPVDCQEAPWSRAQLVMIYDNAKISEPPRTIAALEQWIHAHPGEFTYPAPPDFSGTAFITQLLVQLTGKNFQESFSPDVFATQSSNLWDYLLRIKPDLWRQGKTYPASVEKLNELFTNGEVQMTMSYNPQFAQRNIEQGLFPKSTRTFVFDEGALHNTSYLAMPFNAPNPAGAVVVTNFLQSPAAQIVKQDPKVLGALTVLDVSRLPKVDQEQLQALRGEATMTLDVLAKHRIPEPYHDWNKPIQDGWRTHVASQ